jgi:hypothetical protein
MMAASLLPRYRRHLQSLAAELDRISVAPAPEDEPVAEEEPPAPAATD